MIPKNEAFLQRQDSLKELSWMDRMQLKLESLCEAEAARNHNLLFQETSAYLEKQVSTVGTNMRKFCAEFVKELLLPEAPDKVEASYGDTQTVSGLTNSGQTEKTKSSKIVESPIFNPEGSISGSSLEVEVDLDLIPVEQVNEKSQEVVPSKEASNPSIVEYTVVVPAVDGPPASQRRATEEDAEQYAQWFVSEDYIMAMKLGKTSSLQSCDGHHQRAPSSDSLLDWELV